MDVVRFHRLSWIRELPVSRVLRGVFTEASTRCFAADRGLLVQEQFATRSGTGITRFAARSSADSAAPTMSERSNGAAPAHIGNRELLRDVARGLAMPQKELDPKYFYDERGSALFEMITELPEYYLTRAERKLLESEIPSFIGQLQPRSLVELGAGSASKTRIILDAMIEVGSGAQYVPVDVSRDFLEESARRLRESYADLEVITAVGDFSHELYCRKSRDRHFSPSLAARSEIRQGGGRRRRFSPVFPNRCGQKTDSSSALIPQGKRDVEAAYNDVRREVTLPSSTPQHACVGNRSWTPASIFPPSATAPFTIATCIASRCTSIPFLIR